MRDLSRPRSLALSVLLVSVLTVLAVVPPASGAAGSVEVVVLVPSGTFRVGDTVTANVRVFNLGIAADPQNLTLFISGATADRSLTYVRVGIGAFTSTFQIQAGDPAGDTHGGPTDVVRVQANVTVAGFAWTGVGDVSVWPVPASLEMVLWTPTSWTPAGSPVPVNATVLSFGLLTDPDTILVSGAVLAPGSGYGPSSAISMSRIRTGVYSGQYAVPASTPQDSILMVTGIVDLGAETAIAPSRTVLIGRAHAFTIWDHVLSMTSVSTVMSIFVADETAWPVGGANVSLYYPVGSCSGSGCPTPRWVYGTTDAFGAASFTLTYPAQAQVFLLFWGKVAADGHNQTFVGWIVDPSLYTPYRSLCPSNGAVSYAPGDTVLRTYHTSCVGLPSNQTFYYYASTAHAVVANGSVRSAANGSFTLSFVAPSEDVLIEFRTNLTYLGWARYWDAVLVADPGLIQISNLAIGQVAQITVDLVNVSGSVSFVPYNATAFTDAAVSDWMPLSWSLTYDVVPAVPGSPFHADLVLPRFLPKDQDYLLTVSANQTVLDPGYTYAKVVHMTNALPAASARVSTGNPVAGQPVTVNASGSSDPDGLIVLYRVDWGDGFSVDWTESQEATHAYSSPGTYTATVYVQDDSGAESQVTLTVVVEGTVLGVRASTFYLGILVAVVALAAVVITLRHRRGRRPKSDTPSAGETIPPPEPGGRPPGNP